MIVFEIEFAEISKFSIDLIQINHSLTSILLLLKVKIMQNLWN